MIIRSNVFKVEKIEIQLINTLTGLLMNKWPSESGGTVITFLESAASSLKQQTRFKQFFSVVFLDSYYSYQKLFLNEIFCLYLVYYVIHYLDHA